MHASLAELLESLKPGLLWVTRDGLVRYANGTAAGCTGLVAGRKLWDPDLARAVSAVVATGAARAVDGIGVAPAGGAAPALACRVIPGLSRDDAFVLIQTDSAADGTAFDNLMQVIGCDLREPLKQARAGLAQAHEDAGARSPLAPLLDGVQSLLQSLDTLLDLASVWRSGALLGNDRIELWPLLQHVWADVEPLALERRVDVRFRAQTDTESLAALYGSASWLKRVIQECLEAALRASPAGATLHIEHRQMGPRALIVFRDCGAFAAPDASAIAMPSSGRGARAGAPRLAARDQIGLELCRHVLALHGGQLREEREDGMRNFLIELPTGAPFRADQASIDVAQVQQYAHDLAALMARARQQGTAAATAAKPPSPVAGA